MDFFKGISTKWPAEELKEWSSIRKTAYFLLPMLIYFFVHDVAEILLWAVMEFVVSSSRESILQFIKNNSYTIQGLINGLTIIIGISVIWSAVSSEISLKGQEKSKIRISQTVMNYLLLGLLAISVAIGINILLDLMGLIQRSEVYSQVAMQQYGVNFWMGLILYGIFAPFAEEALFRGLLFSRMKRCFGFAAGLTVSALLFGCYHGNMVQAIYGTILGLLIAYVYEKYKSFAAPVLFHSVANLSIFSLTYGNRLANLKRGTEAIIGAAALGIAAVCFLVISKRDK